MVRDDAVQTSPSLTARATLCCQKQTDFDWRPLRMRCRSTDRPHQNGIVGRGASVVDACWHMRALWPPVTLLSCSIWDCSHVQRHWARSKAVSLCLACLLTLTSVLHAAALQRHETSRVATTHANNSRQAPTSTHTACTQLRSQPVQCDALGSPTHELASAQGLRPRCRNTSWCIAMLLSTRCTCQGSHTRTWPLPLRRQRRARKASNESVAGAMIKALHECMKFNAVGCRLSTCELTCAQGCTALRVQLPVASSLCEAQQAYAAGAHPSTRGTLVS